MPKTKNNSPMPREILVFILWVVGLFPIILYQFSMGIIAYEPTLAMVLIVASYIALPLIPLSIPLVKKSIKTLPISALISLCITAALSIDLWSEQVFDEICGSGFTAGNCFLADGLGVYIYLFIIPILIFYTNIRLTMFINDNTPPTKYRPQ